MKISKLIIAAAAVFGIIYLIKKSKESSSSNAGTGNGSGTVVGAPNGSGTVVGAPNQVGSNTTQTKHAQIIVPGMGTPGNRIVWKDITSRRCIDPNNGQTIYVNGPCPR